MADKGRGPRGADGPAGEPAGRAVALGPEDLALWRRVTASLRRLREEDGEADGSGRPPRPGERSSRGASKSGQPVSSSIPRPAPPMHSAGVTARTELSRRELRRLKKGNRALDAVIDLHGLDRIAAHDHLLARLRQLQAAGARTVLVVTGKGRGGPKAPGEERGVLSRLLPLWLGEAPFRALVHTAHRAAPHHGGEGAVYLLLRRRRRGSSS